MNNYSIILFDLDGTLSDPKIGITKSVQYALEKMNRGSVALDELVSFIGPPLHESFSTQYHMSDIEYANAISFYRERFTKKGMFENELYSGIPLLLQKLKEQQKTLVIATSKPTVYAEEIIKYFQIDQYFDAIVGSHLDGTRSAKTEIITYIMNQFHQFKAKDYVMIGDRKHDIIGASNCGIASIGVTYGYGSNEELKESNPTMIVHNLKQLESKLLTEG